MNISKPFGGNWGLTPQFPSPPVAKVVFLKVGVMVFQLQGTLIGVA